MNKRRVAIIEDEVPAARLLHAMVCRLRPEWEVIVLPGNVEEAGQWFAMNAHPDLLFLDIQLSDGNSFDFLSVARPVSMVIFTTAYDQYAIRAFTVNSIGYILKPVDEKRLLEAIVKYETLLDTKNVFPDGCLDIILNSLQHREKPYRTRFLISGGDRFHPLEVADIAYFYTENKVTFAVTSTGQEHIVDLSLNKLAEQLDPDQFFRANRQILLCIRAIVRIEPYFNGKIVVFVKPPFKSQITINQEKITAFKLWLNF